MGVKEYKFLTRTMKTISARSNKLEKAKSHLPKTENSLKDSRASARSVRAKVKRAEASKQRTSDSSHRSEWGSLDSLKKEIKATRSKLKTEEEAFTWRITLFYFLDEEYPICVRCKGEGSAPAWSLKSECSICKGSGTDTRWTVGNQRRNTLWTLGFLVALPLIWSLSLMHFFTSSAGPLTDAQFFGVTLFSIIITSIMTKSTLNYWNNKFMPYHEIQSKLNVLSNREEILKKEENKRRRSNSKLRALKKELSELESDIEDSVKLRDSTKKEIKLLEKEIPQLWDSIAHLIPFSNALEKA